MRQPITERAHANHTNAYVIPMRPTPCAIDSSVRGVYIRVVGGAVSVLLKSSLRAREHSSASLCIS